METMEVVLAGSFTISSSLVLLESTPHLGKDILDGSW
jgi:hypothetical protein